MNKREQRKEDWRANIFRAAEDLIRETGRTDFSMNALAARANVSTPTPYNLIGSKAAILYSLLHRYQDSLDERRDILTLSAEGPIFSVLQSVDAACDVYTSDGEFVRPLMLFLLGVNEGEHRSIFMERGQQYWSRSIAPLKDRFDQIGINRRLIAREMLIFFTGLFDFWVNLEIDDEQFRASARYGTALRLLPFANDVEVAALFNDMKDSEAKLHTPVIAD